MAQTAPAIAASPAPPVPASLPVAAPPKTLDELMLAMDVVDTLRHQEGLVQRELDETRREADLLDRLRAIYRGQGIEVSDRVLQEGVQALKESRFVYTPPAPGLATTLARLWVARDKAAKGLLGILAALGLGWGAYQFGVVQPEQQRAEQARIEADRNRVEVAERLPRALEQGHADVLAEAQVDAARTRADALLRDGGAALARNDAAGARQAIEQLEELRAELRREYVLRIVSRGETGVMRVPERNRSARNLYIVVEPVAADGRVLSVPVTNEETGRVETVSKWGVRVGREVFDAVRRDKNDDGIIQRNRLGEKRRGFLDVDYAMPVLGGAITAWEEQR
jgi:hypothetical protein